MRARASWILFGLIVSSPTTAFADVISDEEAECRSKKAGDACTVRGEAGTCATSSCARNDYSEGVPPKTKQVECLICEPGKPAEKVEAEEEAPEATKEATKEEAPEKSAEAEKKSGGCVVGGEPPLSLGLAFLGLGVLARRRRVTAADRC